MRKEKKKVWSKRTPDNRHLRRADGELLGGYCALFMMQGILLLTRLVFGLGCWDD
jgi:hypothetical protein